MAQIIIDSSNNLIQGDFDNATVNNRTKFKTTTLNGTTNVYAVPNGSSTSAGYSVSNAADPTNASKLTIATNGATDTQIISGINGTGSYLPMSFYTNNTLGMQLSTAGVLTVTGGVTGSSLPAGSVIQVIQTVKTDTFSTASTITSNGTALVNTGAAVTGLSASITPSSASNKVLVRVTFYGCGTSAVGQLLALLLRGSTVIGNAAQSGTARAGINGRATYVAVPNYGACVSIEYLDSPSTTSSTTYQVNVGSDTGTVYVGRTQTDGDNSLDSRSSSTITLMEIKA